MSIGGHFLRVLTTWWLPSSSTGTAVWGGLAGSLGKRLVQADRPGRQQVGDSRIVHPHQRSSRRDPAVAEAAPGSAEQVAVRLPRTGGARRVIAAGQGGVRGVGGRMCG